MDVLDAFSMLMSAYDQFEYGYELEMKENNAFLNDLKESNLNIYDETFWC
jgi:hypothetical protein